MNKSLKKQYYLYEMNITTLNIISIVLLIVMILITYILYPEFKINNISFALFILLMIAYMILHELLHSLAYVINGADFKKIVYGAKLELGVFYCLCKQNISKKNILHSLMYPFLFIGIITYLIGVYFHLPILVLLSIVNISGCSGDIIMFMFISRLKDIEFTEMDNEISFGIYSSNDISNSGHFGLKYKGKADKIERADYTKIKISKLSWIFLIMFLLFAFLEKYIINYID